MSQIILYFVGETLKRVHVRRNCNFQVARYILQYNQNMHFSNCKYQHALGKAVLQYLIFPM